MTSSVVPYLYKWAQNKFHPSRHATLQVQTLHRFRCSELGDRSDESEGTYKFIVKFPNGTVLPINVVSELLGGRIHLYSGRPILSPPGCLTLINDFLHLGGAGGAGMREIEGRFQLIHETWNGFVLCLTTSGSLEDNLFEDSKPLWKFPVSKADSFAQTLANTLLETAKKGNFTKFEWGLSKGKSHDDVAVRWEHRLVEYLDREMTISPSNASADLAEVGRRVAISPFIKPMGAMQNGVWRNFQAEREYRFVFEFSAGGPLMPVKQTHRDIPYSLLSGVLEVIGESRP